jgi:hypothetical protein
MNPKEIGRTADRIFQATLPSNWALRSQQDQEDYGVDYEIEVMLPNDQATGFLFKVQQKGAEHLDENLDRDAVIYRDLKVARVGYYLHQLRIPLILVVVEVGTGQVYWIQLQGNPEVESAYQAALARSQKTVTVYLPRSQSLPAACDALLEAASRSQAAVTTRSFATTPSPRILEAAVALGNIGETLRQSRDHVDLLRLHDIEQRIQGHNRDEALRMCQDILTSPSEGITLRFAAGLNVIRLRIITLGGESALGRHRSLQLRLETTESLLRLVRPFPQSPEHLRLYARLLSRSARITPMIDRYQGLFATEIDARTSGNAPLLSIVRAEKAQAIAQAYSHLLRAERHFARLVQRKHIPIAVQSLPMLLMDSITFVHLLRCDGRGTEAESLVSWFDQACASVVDLAARIGDWGTLAFCAMQRLPLAAQGDREDLEARARVSEGFLLRIEDPAFRELELQKLAQKKESLLAGPPEMTVADAQEMARERAITLGIDLSSTMDPRARLVGAAIDDMNPERVLQRCESIYILLGPPSAASEALGLPTLCQKWVACTRFEYSTSDLTIDSAYQRFHQSYCSICTEARPRSADWRWNPEWQEQQDAVHRRATRDRLNLL